MSPTRDQALDHAITAARAAYRLGLLDAILHPDVQQALPMPGIIRASFEGEREYRLQELAAWGVEPQDLADLDLNGRS